jgi:hypothetical protein
VSILRDPEIIAAEVEKRRHDGGLDRDRVAIEKQLASIADKQERTARAIAAVDDDDASAPLLVELRALADRKKAVEIERDDLLRRIADRDAETERVATLAHWCRTVATNLDTLSYEEKRLALSSLGVKVRVYRLGTTDLDGNLLPRWEMEMRPTPPDKPIVNCSTCRTAPTPCCCRRR